MRNQNRTPVGKAAPKRSLRQDFDLLSDDVMLTSHELAELLSLSPWTIKFWRYEGKGPRPTKLGRSLRFRAADVREWLSARRQAS